MLPRLADEFEEHLVPGCFLVHGPPSSDKSLLLRRIVRSNQTTVIDMDETFSMEQVRESLAELSQTISIASDDDMIIAIPFIDEWRPVAQKVLLTFIEKSLVKGHFAWILVSQNASRLLPALRSRCTFIRVPSPQVARRPLESHVSSALKLASPDQVLEETTRILQSGFTARQVVEELAH